MQNEISASTEVSRLSDTDFKTQLAAVLPQLRAFARSLAGNRDTADDLVQETMLKVWRARERYVAGTNFRAWAFVILRNHFLSEMRRKRFVGEWDELVADRVLAAPAGQEKSVELRDMMRALIQLPVPQREALILVGAGGISYEETAEIIGVAVGTIKSRVARARIALEELLNGGSLENNRADINTQDNVVVSIFDYLESIRARHGLDAKPVDISQRANAA
ncbi:sigma-70 family RNA polymerase sigma factor [Sphingobium sp. AP49]|uniref:sigma-70 family RNA polymerase sigma factor n=1 Tax=Sphingobium sp. AP49 TaxID=1144307 RepID=UPI00026ED7B1|nr:sigma-70 family RNA polymerase sigma factor [Sphingobium sp. AP49]WHO41072.1 sigma-70 family RNA polymerase sigma factor [Sphingobium sp. AP49]